jgi:cellulose synthase/poly-beta-1,6-N-acetylglucosamine synthase-like glycosyltransferase
MALLQLIEHRDNDISPEDLEHLDVSDTPQRITVLIAAHNEEESIGAAVDSCLEQTRRPDLVVIMADNCTDRSVEICQARDCVVYETVDNGHKKSGALNQGWVLTHDLTDLYIFIDADTILPRTAIADWEREMAGLPHTAALSGKFTMLTQQQMADKVRLGLLPRSCAELPTMTKREEMWVRVQRAEFSKWADAAMTRKGRWTNVIGGCAAAIRKQAIAEVVEWRAEHGEAPQPWTYTSDVEDFELTYRMRSLGWHCAVSENVRAYTGVMRTLRKLWAQRMKWQVGTCADLKDIGWNRLTRFDWYQQLLGLSTAFFRLSWIALLLTDILVLKHIHFLWFWWMFPVFFTIFEVREALRIPNRQWQDLAMAMTFITQECFAWVRGAWCLAAWYQVVRGNKKDRWALQIAAETGRR